MPLRVKLINFTSSKKFKLLNIVYSNNEIYIYDINKAVKLMNNDNGEDTLKKYRSISLKTNERITCIDSQIDD